MAKTKVRNSPEAKRWLIVGAYQAGATEKQVARISGLSKTAVRNIILNYQRTGTPCIPKKIPNKIRQKLIVEYDEHGNIIDSDNDEEEEDEEVVVIPQQPSSKSIKKKIIVKKKHVFKKPNNTAAARNLIKIKNQSSSSGVTTKDIIHYAMDQMRITDDNNHLNQSLLTLSSKEDSVLISPTTPTPNTTTTNNNLKRLPPPMKFDQDIRGYELWTHDDDMLLLNHVLHHLHGGGWNELEVRFNGRHSARLCYDRWKHLKSLLLKSITDKPHTPW